MTTSSNTIWKYNAATDQIEETGIPSKMRETICAAGITPAQFEQHVRQREQILSNLLNRDIRDIDAVAKVIQGFYATLIV